MRSRTALVSGIAIISSLTVGVQQAEGLDLFSKNRGVKKEEIRARSAGCDAGGCPWMRPNTVLPARKLRVIHEDGALVVEHGSSVTQNPARDPRLGDSHNIYIGGKRSGMVITTPGAEGDRTLTLVSPTVQGTVHLTMYNDRNKPPTVVIISETARGRQTQDYGVRDADAAMQVIRALGGPAIAPTRFDLQRTVNGSGVWAKIDGVLIDLSTAKPRALPAWDRAILGPQLQDAADLLRELSIPGTKYRVPMDKLQEMGLRRPVTATEEVAYESKSTQCRDCMTAWGLGD